MLVLFWSVVRTVLGESGMGEEESMRGGSRTGDSFGDSFDMLYEAMEDMGLTNLVRGGADRMASCCC
jgi:hypothetical protein